MNKSRSKRLFDSSAARGMTLTEVLGFAVLILCIVVGAKEIGDHFGAWYGYVLGGVAGVVIWLVGLISLLSVLQGWTGQGLPPCRNGCCHGPSDYKIIRVNSSVYHQCNCGNRYDRRGRRFVQISEDGSESAYLVWRPFRGWFPEEAAAAKKQETAPKQ